MQLEWITENNISFTVLLQEKLVPGESAKANYEEPLEESSCYEYYLIYEGKECAGIIGLYYYPDDLDSA